jgi:hypothetical protein
MRAQMTMIQYRETVDDPWMDHCPYPSARQATAALPNTRDRWPDYRFRVVPVAETALDRLAGGYLPAWLTP